MQQQAGGAVFRRKRRKTGVATHARAFEEFSALFTICCASPTMASRCDWSLKLVRIIEVGPALEIFAFEPGDVDQHLFWPGPARGEIFDTKFGATGLGMA